MYSKKEGSEIRKQFWMRFGKYMRPVRSAGNESVTWLNYKTGVRNIFFRMDADTRGARISIELRHPDSHIRLEIFERLKKLEHLVTGLLQELWKWEQEVLDSDGRMISRISNDLSGVNIMDTADWPAIMSFFTPRIRALDEFWVQVKDGFE